MSATEIVSVKQAAEYLSVPESMVLRMIGDGRLAGYVDLWPSSTPRLRPVRGRR